MTQFQHIETDIEPDEMDGEDAKETLAKFMDVHEDNATAYSDVKEQADKADELETKFSEAQSQIEEFEEELRPKAAENSRFSQEELAEFGIGLDKLYDLSFSTDEPEDDDPDDDDDDDGDDSPEDEAQFSNNPSQAGLFETDTDETGSTDQAEDNLASFGLK